MMINNGSADMYVTVKHAVRLERMLRSTDFIII